MMTINFRNYLAALVVVASPLAGCDLFEVEDRPSPNGIAFEDIIANPTEANLATLGIGIEAQSRTQLGTYLADVGMLGREYWRISPSDPRFTADLLGRGDAVIDDNTFYITNPWAARYANIRNANTLLVAVDGNTSLDEGEKGAVRGFARTWKAYQYLLNLNLTYENGIRLIGAGEDEAGDLVSYEAALDHIAELLNLAAPELQGGDLFFGTSVGEDYYRINRALASRVDLYREDWEGALSAVEEAGVQGTSGGAFHVFSSSPGDVQNPFFFDPQSNGDAVLVHPSFIADIDSGDVRISKAELREEPRTFDGLSSNYGLDRYETPDTSIPIFRNAELILNRAEARAQTNNLSGAIADINTIRIGAGLDEYEGGEDQASVIDEILYQRRYELYAEGHRWIDVRRYGRLDTLPIDREGDDVFAQFPVPQNDQ